MTLELIGILIYLTESRHLLYWCREVKYVPLQLQAIMITITDFLPVHVCSRGSGSPVQRFSARAKLGWERRSMHLGCFI